VGYVAQPYRVLYESKGFRSGLSDIRAVVLKPDKTIAGPFVMSELPGILAGRYCFDYITGPTDQPGEYIVGIFSPSENFQTTYRMPLYAPYATSAQVTNILNAIDEVGDVVDLISACVL
jgi:hypothetical protein